MPPVAENLGGAKKTPSYLSTKAPDQGGSSTPLDASDDPAIPTNLQNIQVTAVTRRKPKNTTTMDAYASDKNATKDFFKKEPCLHSHRIFERAAKIFDGLTKAKQEALQQKDEAAVRPRAGSRTKSGILQKSRSETVIPTVDFKSPNEKKLTFELAFAAMKYHGIFEEMLEDVSFFSQYSQFREVEALVMVVLWDYQSRKFQMRVPFDGETLNGLISKIEAAIIEQKTKLAASLARRRIKAAAPNIEFLLPENVRRQTSNQRPMPCYTWVNTIKIHPSELMQRLRDEGFVHMWFPPKTMEDFKEKSFFLDPQCSDVIVFSVDCNTILQEHPLVEQGFIVRQDKSSCLAAHCMPSLVGDEQEVLVVNPGSGLLPAHIAMLLKDRKGSVVAVCDHNDDEYNKMMQNIQLLGVSKWVRVIREKFLQMDPDDPQLKTVRAALVVAKCSKNAIHNIVNFIVTEGENLQLLQELSDVDDDLEERLNRLQADHVSLLRHALKLHRIQGVTYMTRSTNDMENELAVEKAIEYVNMQQMAHRLMPWRVIPPVLPFSAEEIDEQIGINGKYVKFLPTKLYNGSFITCLAREPENPAEVLARSKSKAKGGKSRHALHENDSGSDEEHGPTPHRRKSSVKKVKVRKGVANKSTTASSSRNKAKVGSDVKVPEHKRVIRHPAPFR